MVKTAIITGYGINADLELEAAFKKAGSDALRIHISELTVNPSLIDDFRILAFPGGFSFGDHLGSGKVFAYMFRKALKAKLEDFIDAGGIIIGICNGFQVLVKMGVLPNLEGGWNNEVSLIHNDSGVFEDSWVRVHFEPDSPCIWTKGQSDMDMPIRHGEGKFIIGSAEIRDRLEGEKLIALRYVGRNPNGSELDIAGICDRTGRILGLMPHPEAFLYPENHPKWTREIIMEASGLNIFKNGVNFIRSNF